MSDFNERLNKAKFDKKDEFYTLFGDIEKEMVHYREYFRDKIVYCNCDNPRESAFWEYFHLNFTNFGLKKLVSTHYTSGAVSFVCVYEGGDDSNMLTGAIIPLTCDGDFRSSECLKLLADSDIIVTNPPFSLFREFIAILMSYNKDFIILGNMNAITCKDVFPLIRDNKMWYGVSIHSSDREFRVPDSYPLEARGCRIDEKGNKYISVKGVRWFTNIDHAQRHSFLVLNKTYNAEDYPQYENYAAINVNKTADIPCDYDGVMGVPISYFDKYCPEQFEILGHTAAGGNNAVVEELRTDKKNRGRGIIAGKTLYDRILIRKRA